MCLVLYSNNYVTVEYVTKYFLNSNLDVNHELEEKIANITKLVQAELEEEKRRKRNQGVLVEEHGESLDVDDTKILVPVSLQNLLNSSRWVKKDGIDTSETLQTKILKGIHQSLPFNDLKISLTIHQKKRNLNEN